MSCCSVPGGDGLILLALILIAGFVYWRTSNWLVGEAKAVSGHTIKVGKKEMPVRLHALYSLQVTPPGHPNQPWTDASDVVHDGGVIAKGKLAERVAGKKVKVRIGLQKRNRSFGREVGQVFVDCEDVGLWMVKSGYAFADNQDEDRNRSILKRYRSAAKKAKRKNLGFHTGQYDDPLDWIKERLEKRLQDHGRPIDTVSFARRDPDGFEAFIEDFAKEIGEEFVIELGAELLLML